MFSVEQMSFFGNVRFAIVPGLILEARSPPEDAKKSSQMDFAFFYVFAGRLRRLCVEHVVEKCLAHAPLHCREAMFAPKRRSSRNPRFPYIKPMILASLSERYVQTWPPVGPQGPPSGPQGVPRGLWEGPLFHRRGLQEARDPWGHLSISERNLEKNVFSLIIALVLVKHTIS